MRGLRVDFAVDRHWVPAVVGLDFHVHSGEVLAIVGESGSGKTASSMALLGLLAANGRATGSVWFNGAEILNATPGTLRRIRGKDIAMIFQDPMTALNPVFTVGFQIVETLRQHSAMSPAQARSDALRMLASVELPDPERTFDSYPHQLSGGQRQRALIAQSLCCRPKLLIADEATTALDVIVQAEILDLLRRLRTDLDAAIVLITHDLGVVADLADRVIVMSAGVAVETGTAHGIFSAPRHEYTKALLQAVPRLGRRPATAPAEDCRAEGPTEEGRAAGAGEGRGRPVLELSGVGIDYPGARGAGAFRAVDGIDLTIYPSELVGLVGESGSGKTSVGHAAVGLLPVTAGVLRLLDRRLDSVRPRELRALQERVGMVFQEPSGSLNPRMPVAATIGEPLLLAKGWRGAGLQRRVDELLDQVQLPRSHRNRYPHELSEGQKQRVAIARALSLSPDLLVADEPTSALDVSVQAKVLDLLRMLQRELGFACLFITHDLSVADSLADRIVVLQGGRIVEQGPREQVFGNPRDDYTRRLLAAVPVPDPDSQRLRRNQRARPGVNRLRDSFRAR
ncbi:ABC transporter ATP-binding protein [Paenarthrobacter sp. PH39-S1]|nr:ABC transporter ATP-binding protein [Paenarthrobacter sp. PH39-S1]MDJ0355653.1 ABC transporter ATP-binding protein [Paenarthrobacter sp. PH39-S1]